MMGVHMIELAVGKYYRNRSGELVFIEDFDANTNQFFDQDGFGYWDDGQPVRGGLSMQLVCEI